jgi:hypothetical protein
VDLGEDRAQAADMPLEAANPTGLAYHSNRNQSMSVFTGAG